MAANDPVEIPDVSTKKPAFLDDKLNRAAASGILLIFLALGLGGITIVVNDKIMKNATSPERIQAMREMVELQERMARISEPQPVYEPKTADFVPPTQQQQQPQQQQVCSTHPSIGWESHYSTLSSMTDKNEPNCMDFVPQLGHDFVKIYFYRVPRAVRGKFIVSQQNGNDSCNTEGSNDNCLSFVQSHTQQHLKFTGERIFIQTAPFN